MATVAETLKKYAPEPCAVTSPSGDFSGTWGGDGMYPLPSSGQLYFSGQKSRDKRKQEATRFGVYPDELLDGSKDGDYFKAIDVYKDGNGNYTRNQTGTPAGKLIQKVNITLPSGKVVKPELNVFAVASLQQIMNEIKQHNETSSVKFSVNSIGNGWRKASSSSPKGNSRHCRGVAIDVNAGSGGNPWFNTHIPRDNTSRTVGESKPWSIKSCSYSGNYDPTKCLWSWNHPVVQIFIRNGWGWGGAYGDVMHFSMDDGC